MIPPTPEQRLAVRERPAGAAIMRQRWAGLGFFHWAVEPEIIAARLPPGLHVDTFEGRAWLGVVPFFMQRIRPGPFPPLPWLSWFLELNVRTYVHDEHGNAGVWFFSLDCNQPLAVLGARKFFNLPYEHARMSATTRKAGIDYRSTRVGPGHPEGRFHYPVAKSPQAAAAGSLEWFLVERYLLFCADRNGRLHIGRVHHEPYEIVPMGKAECSNELLALNGFPKPERPPDSMLSAATVDVSIFPLERSP